MRARPLTPRAICVPGQGLRIGVTDAATMSTKARVISPILPDVRSQKGGSRQVKRQLLHRRIEQHRARAHPPLGHARRYAGIECGQIGFHRAGLEGEGQGAAMQAMFFEVEQHQAARKQPAEDRLPAMGGGEKPRLIKQYKFVGFGAQQRDAGFAEHAAAGNQPVFCRHPFDFTFRVCKDRSVRPTIGQPSSPGMCASELRWGGFSVIAAEATLCIDMAIAPVGRGLRKYPVVPAGQSLSATAGGIMRLFPRFFRLCSFPFLNRTYPATGQEEAAN